jgi:serine protease Do
VVSKLDALAVAAVTGDIPQNINFAVKGSPVAAHLKAHNVSYITAGGSKNATLSTAELARRAQDMTFQVECQR